MRINRAAICSAAHTFFKAGKSKSEAMRSAWDAFKVFQFAAENGLPFEYVKTDGSKRTAKVGPVPSDYVSKGTGRKPAAGLVTYWDLDAKGFRAFYLHTVTVDRSAQFRAARFFAVQTVEKTAGLEIVQNGLWNEAAEGLKGIFAVLKARQHYAENVESWSINAAKRNAPARYAQYLQNAKNDFADFADQVTAELSKLKIFNQHKRRFRQPFGWQGVQISFKPA